MSSSYPRDHQVDVRQDRGLIEAEQPPSYSEATAYPDSQTIAYSDSQATAYLDTPYTAYPSHTFPGVHQSPQTTFALDPASQEADSRQDSDANLDVESMAVREDEEPAKRGLSDPCTRCAIVAVVLTVHLIIVIIVLGLTS